MDFFINIVCAILANIAFSVFFNVPKRAIIYCTITGTVGWITYYILHLKFLGNAGSIFFSAIVIGLFAEYFSYRIKMPSTVFIYIGIIMLVPGYGMYMSMEHFANEEYMLAFNTGFIAVVHAICIAVGILISSVFSKSIKRVKLERFNKLNEVSEMLENINNI